MASAEPITGSGIEAPSRVREQSLWWGSQGPSLPFPKRAKFGHFWGIWLDMLKAALLKWTAVLTKGERSGAGSANF